jgi:ADP-ribosylglycohydrolase
MNTIKPDYSSVHDWEFYASALPDEYTQCIDEGLDIEQYKPLFDEIAKLPKDEIKKKLGDVIFEIVSNARPRPDYKYNEPSDPDGIKALLRGSPIRGDVNPDTLFDKIHGAWVGRIVGCMLGKTVEGIRTNELIPFLKETGNFPLHRYIYRSDLTDEICDKYKFSFRHTVYADEIDGMPVDDDTNYVILAQLIVDRYGKEFTPDNVAKIWLDSQNRNAYCTAERVAFRNLSSGYTPPFSAVYKNPYREWIGAQIRGDYFGYINPGNPEKAAETAWRDASISHIKNGIYGEMFISAMIASAAVESSTEKIIQSGLAQIPYTSRLYEAVSKVIDMHRSGTPKTECFDCIHSLFDEYTGYGWCHTIPNAMIVTASLLYGEGDFGKSICMAVETGFDTDCNGATVGSILGMANGIDGISEYWQKPINNTLHTSVFGVGTVRITDKVRETIEHIKMK